MRVRDLHPDKLLRQRAERMAQLPHEGPQTRLEEADASRLIHELRVYQIELEMQNAELVDSRERLEALSQRQVAVQEEERRRLAMRLYDRTSANLAALDLLVRTLAGGLPPAASAERAALEDIQALLRDTGDGIRTICTDLRPVVLDYAGIVPALESYARTYAAQHGLVVLVDAPGEGRRLPPDLESTLFRIVQEALNCSMRYSHATEVRVSLVCDVERVVLEISDDGRGKDAAALQAALTIMRERAEFNGGEFAGALHEAGGMRIRAVW